MRFMKLLFLACALALGHLLLLKVALITQALPYMFWPSVGFRLLLLVLAGIPFALQNLLHLKLGWYPHSIIIYSLYYLGVLLVWPRLTALWKVVKAPSSASRRAVLLGGSVVALGTAGVAQQNFHLHTLRFPLMLKDLPESLRGLKVAVVADLHRGPSMSQAFLVETVKLINSLQPDIVLMPGDFIAKSPRFYPDIQRALSGLSPGIASFATLGNHDHWEGKEKALNCLHGAGVVTLQNRALYLGADRSVNNRGQAGKSLCLAGVDDLWEGKPDFDFLAHVPAGIPVLLMAHNPDVAEKFSDCGHRVDLQLSGHTHGGQIVLPGVGALATASAYGDKYLYGWSEGPSWPVFTTCGVGTSTVPVRVGTQSEVVLFTLEAEG